AYRDVFTNFIVFVRASGFWILAPVVLAAVARLFGQEVQAPRQPGEPLVIPVELVMISAVGNIIWILGINAVVVFWHRRILLHETGDVAFAPVTGRVLRYLLASLALALVVA